MVNIKRGVELVVGFLVVGILAAALLPEAVDEIINVTQGSADPANQTGFEDWGGIEQTLFELLPMAVVLGAFLYFIAVATDFI